MNKLFVLAVTLLLAGKVNSQQVQHVDANYFYDLVKSGKGIVLDVRTKGEFSRGHIKNATLISIYDVKFREKARLLQKAKPVYVYCLTGSRSKVVANYLSQNGFAEIYNLASGILEWQRFGYPVEQSEQVVSSTGKSFTNQEISNLIETNSLVLVDFYAPWCAPCKKMSPVIEKLKGTYTGKAIIEKVDIEANKSIKSSYNIQSIPGFVLFKDGEEVWRHTGLISYDDLSAKINSFL